MFGVREAGVWGATVFLAGGVAYFIWRYASSAEKKSRPETCAKKDQEEKERLGEEEERTEEKVVVVAATPVVAAIPEKASEVKCRLNRTHLPKYLSPVCADKNAEDRRPCFNETKQSSSSLHFDLLSSI